MFKRVVGAVDLAESGFVQRVVDVAAELARQADGHLRLVYVRYMVEAALTYIPMETLRADETKALRRLREIADAVALSSDRVSIASPLGSAYREILSAAQEFDADLIVVGAHSPSMAKFLLGADAHRIIQRAPMSVLVVR